MDTEYNRGECFEKYAAYTEILRDFVEQQELVKIVRKNV